MNPSELFPDLERLSHTPLLLWERLRSLLSTASWEERGRIVARLSEWDPPPELIPYALRVLEEEGEVPLKTAVHELLERWAPRILPQLKEALLHPRYRGKKFLVEILASLKERFPFHEIFLLLLRDPDPNLKVAVLESLAPPITAPEFSELLGTFQGEKEPMVLFAYLSLFQRLLHSPDFPYKERFLELIPTQPPPGYLLGPWLEILSAYPPEKQARILSHWEQLLHSPHHLEEWLRWFTRRPLGEQRTLLQHLNLAIPSGVLEEVRAQTQEPEVFEGVLALAARFCPERFPHLFRSGTLPRLPVFEIIGEFLPPPVLRELLKILREQPSLHGRKLFLYLAALLEEKGVEELFLLWGAQYPQLRPWIFRYGAELGYRWVLQWLPELFRLPEEEFVLVKEGLRVFTYRERREVVGLFSPLVKEVQLSREWVRALGLVENLGLYELRPFVEQALRHQEPELRAEALRLISEFYLDEAGPYIRLGLNDEALLVRLKSLELWENLATSRDRTEIEALLRDPVPWIRARALVVAVRVLGKEPRFLFPFLEDEDPCVRFFALKLLKGMKAHPPFSLWRRTLGDPHPLVILESLPLGKDLGKGAREALAGLLKHPSWMVRFRTVETLGALGEFPLLKEHEDEERDPEIRAYLVNLLKFQDLSQVPFPEELFWLRALYERIYEESGILIPPSQYGQFRFRLLELVRSQGIREFSEFYMRLHFHPFREELLLQGIEAISTGETFFYRESSSLEFFLDYLYPRLRRNIPKGLPLRVYSIGCSTGEEPYTLAILARERGILPQELAIIGTDIHRGALTRARQGFYRPRSLESLPPFLRERYFREEGGGFRLDEEILRYVSFIHWNLLDERPLSFLPPADAIFCRNLLIYFDHHSRKRAVSSFEKLLKPGGVLILGHTETLLHIPTALTMHSEEGEFYYEKPFAYKNDHA